MRLIESEIEIYHLQLFTRWANALHMLLRLSNAVTSSFGQVVSLKTNYFRSSSGEWEELVAKVSWEVGQGILSIGSSCWDKAGLGANFCFNSWFSHRLLAVTWSAFRPWMRQESWPRKLGKLHLWNRRSAGGALHVLPATQTMSRYPEKVDFWALEFL